MNYRCTLAVICTTFLRQISNCEAAGEDGQLHQCAVQLQIDSLSTGAGYRGTGTGTLVKEGDGHYLVTALHNLQKSETKLVILSRPDKYFTTDTFEDRFVCIPNSDLAVMKLREKTWNELRHKRFVRLLGSEHGLVEDPAAGQSLAAIGNPVFSFESFSGIQSNIAYHGTVAEYSVPDVLVGNAVAYLRSRMMIVESLSVMPGFSGGPVLIIKDGGKGIGELAGIVVGGDPRSIVSPGRFVFVVPPTDIKRAIDALDKNLKDKKAKLPDDILAPNTELASVPRDMTTRGTFAFSDSRIVVIDVKNHPECQPITDQFLQEIAVNVKNADMVFYGGLFGNANLSLIKPSRATFVKCDFTYESSLSRANLMGARFIGCSMIPVGGGPPQSIKILPTLGYGITVIDGLSPNKSTPQQMASIFQPERFSAVMSGSILADMDASTPVDAAPAPIQDRTNISKEQFENLLTRDLFND